MDVKRISYYTVVDETTKDKLLCYLKNKNEIYSIWLTDATDVWNIEFTEDVLCQFRRKILLKSTLDYVQKIRTALGAGSSCVSVQATGAVLRVDSSPGDLNMTLPRMEEPEAKKEVKELLFTMAEDLCQSDRTAVSPSVSPMKNHQKRHIDFEPRAQRKMAPQLMSKKRLPGDSLINPGSKKKTQATGVAFDEDEED